MFGRENQKMKSLSFGLSRPAVLLCAVSLFAAPVQAAEEDGLPAAEFATIAEAEAETVRAYSEVLDVTSRPVTLAAEYEEFRTYLATATTEHALWAYEDFVTKLWRLAHEAEVMPDVSTLEHFNSVCIGQVLSNCVVTGAGYLNDSDGGAPLLALQTQDGFTPEDGVKDGVVLLVPESNTWRVLSWSFDGYYYQAPRLNEEGYLHVPGILGGSGGGNADLLYVLEDGAWTEIELESWRASLSAYLPEGIGIWQGVDYDFDGVDLVARSPLWRENDGNGTPSAGHATLTFERTGSALVLSSVDADIAE